MPITIATLSGGNGWHVKDLLRAGRAIGCEVTACSWRDVQLDIAVDGAMSGAKKVRVSAGPHRLDEFGAVLLRTMPPGSLEEIVFRMDAAGLLAAAGAVVLNSPRSVEASVDKPLASARLAAAGVPTPPTIACLRVSQAVAAFERLGGDVVIKPVFGSEGFGIVRATDVDVASRVFAAIERIGGVMYLQKFIDHGGSDLRVFTLGGRVLTAMRRVHNHDWRTNVARGAVGEAVKVEPWMADLSIAAAAALGVDIAGVDLAVDRKTGGATVIEVNGVPGWRELSAVTGVDVAVEILRYAISRAGAAGART
jgi:RimK family alpha-L-glutamate ligase